MYDSRSNHERNCSRQKDREATKAQGYDKDGVRLRSRLLPKRVAIAEQVPTVFASREHKGLKRMVRTAHSHFFGCVTHHVAAWEHELLGDGDQTCAYGWVEREVLTWDDRDESLRMSRWECREQSLRGFDAPEGTVWTTATAPQMVPMPKRRVVEEEPEQEPLSDEDLGIVHESVWVDALPVEDFFDRVGYSWVFEGPSDSRKPEVERRDHAYVKASDLAFEVGIETRDLIAFMREKGEWVQSASSWIAEPVAAIARNYREGLIAKYGPRKQATTPARTFAQLCADEEAKVRVANRREHLEARRTAPRPGYNPFRQSDFALAYPR